MKKKLILWAAIAVVLIAAVLVLVIPRPLLRGEEFLISSVEYRMQNVTEQIDPEKLLELLAETETVFSLRGISSYQTAEYPLEINLVIDHKPQHIVMGKRHYVYESSPGMERTIKNGDELYEKILELIP